MKRGTNMNMHAHSVVSYISETYQAPCMHPFVGVAPPMRMHCTISCRWLPYVHSSGWLLYMVGWIPSQRSSEVQLHDIWPKMVVQVHGQGLFHSTPGVGRSQWCSHLCLCQQKPAHTKVDHHQGWKLDSHSDFSCNGMIMNWMMVCRYRSGAVIKFATQPKRLGCS